MVKSFKKAKKRVLTSLGMIQVESFIEKLHLSKWKKSQKSLFSFKLIAAIQYAKL